MLRSPHSFGIYFDKNICSGCLSFLKRKRVLPSWDAFDTELLIRELKKTIGHLPEEVIVPFDSDGETWFVLDLLISLGIRPIVVYFNAQYHDNVFFSILSACQENYDVDFIGFSLPRDKIIFSISEEFSVGSGHCRNIEIFGRHAAALYVARHLGIENIISGPNQQSEVVGSHSFLVKNQLKKPDFNDIVIGKKILPQVKKSIQNINSDFSKIFDENIVGNLFEKKHWHYLSDYIFWDSEAINNYYGEKFSIQPRIVNGYGACWQASSSSLKLEFYDLLRLINTGTSKIDSYLSREIRFGRMSRDEAVNKRNRYLKKDWDIVGISNFLDVPTCNIQKALEIFLKGRRQLYTPNSFSGNGEFKIISHSQKLC
ncbi:hypothetical protein HOL24_09455 [bacterium]|jgi:hypothetical protein|nr:hypothetical protein [bacterium]